LTLSPVRIAIVGFGKIARDQHVPAIAATDGAALALSGGGARLMAGGEVLVVRRLICVMQPCR
jgi:hypothetical protein